jgi:tetratricopeptide (TPR) repeat protein
MFGNPSFADVFPFRVAFENVPGIEEIEAGNIPQGITVLEDQLGQSDQEVNGDIWATLCGAYIVNASLDKAEMACNRAVEIDPTDTAYNNRGVYRVFTGNLSGAREDFVRARPGELDAYLEELRAKDVGLIAVDNFQLIEDLSAKHTAAEINTSVAMGTAARENLGN